MRGRAARLLSILALTSACASSKAILIRANVEAEVVRLNPPQGGTQTLGQTPLRLVGPEGTYILSVNHPDHLPQNVVILVAEDSAGYVNVELESKTAAVAQGGPVVGKGPYLDALLRAHRLFLRGQLDDAKALLSSLELRGGADYGLLVLKGTIALFEGRAVEARKYYDLARALDPTGARSPSGAEGELP